MENKKKDNELHLELKGVENFRIHLSIFRIESQMNKMRLTLCKNSHSSCVLHFWGGMYIHSSSIGHCLLIFT